MDVVSSTFFMAFARTSHPLSHAQHRSIANYKIRNHYFSVRIKSKTSSCVVHFVDYIFLFAIWHNGNSNSGTQVHKVFE